MPFAPGRCVAVLTLSATTAAAGPAAKVRVRGSSRIEATAATTSAGLVLKGTLVEDAGRPVVNALVRVRLVTPEGAPGSLSAPAACSPTGALSAPAPAHGGDAQVRTDTAGRFCLSWGSNPPNGRLSLTFEDERGLLDSAEQWVDARPTAPFELEFARPPRSVSLDAPDVALELVSRVQPGATLGELPLSVLWTRSGAPSAPLATRALRPGESLELHVASRSLGSPGPGEFRAHLGEGARSAEARAEVVVTALVRLRVPKALNLRSSGDGTLKVAVDSAVGPLDAGTVEALLGERTVGIAEVSGGEVTLPLTLGPGPLTAALTVRYLPANPWWIAGPPEQVRVEVAGASAWRTLFWAIALLLIALYITLGWRRPTRSTVRGREPARPPVVPTLRWRPAPKHHEGWSGVVQDSHDRAPISGAFVTALFAGGVERRAVTQPDGRFELPASPALSHRGGRLRVESPWHSSFEGELPAQGLVTIELITRRRALLGRLVAWVGRRGTPWGRNAEPTPGELASSAEALSDRSVATWARAVERAAFGPEAVDREEEARIRALEPDSKA